MPTPPLTGMRKDVEELVIEWGKSSTITRFSSTLNAQGRLSGSFVTVATGEILWVQPIGGGSDIEDLGISDETTHLAWQKFSGFSMAVKDRVAVSGDTFQFDIVRVHIKESHRINELKRDERT